MAKIPVLGNLTHICSQKEPSILTTFPPLYYVKGSKLLLAMRVVDLIERSLKRGFPVSAYLTVANYSTAVWR